MAKIQKSIGIHAPVEDVFRYVNEPANLPEVWPSLIEVSDVERLPNGGASMEYVYKMAGIRLHGSSEDTEVVPNQRIVNKTKGGLQATQTWLFENDAGETKLTWEAEYAVPTPVLGRLAEAVIVKMNEREGELLLANLKARMEA